SAGNEGLLVNRMPIIARGTNADFFAPIAVGCSASTSQNRKAAYSNWGKEISVCAPSDNWHPIDQQAFVPGRGIWTTDNETIGVGFTDNSRYTGNFGGTSSATPLVAGIIGLMRSINPDLSHKQIQQILKNSSDKIEDSNADIVLNHNKGQYNGKGHSEWFGYGKVNAAEAVAQAQSLVKKPLQEEEQKDQANTPEALSTGAGLFIVAALVNPKGTERGNETISLLNISDQAIDLNDWILDTNKTSKEILKNQIIAPGGFLIVQLSKLRLSNSGGKIRLLNAEGSVVHEVTYTRNQAKKEAWSIRF
ncbi:MAG: S8 family serine peptidase, partial [Bacteroidota bacterium]